MRNLCYVVAIVTLVVAAGISAADPPRFYVRNAAGDDILSIDVGGNLITAGSVVENTTEFPDAGGKWIIASASDGSPLAMLDPGGPTLYLKGNLLTQQTSIVAPGKSFIIEDSESAIVAYVSSVSQDDPDIPAGSLVLMGTASEGGEGEGEGEG